MAIDFTPLEEGSSGGIQFTPLEEEPTVKPGDVAARMQQVQANQAGPVRERATILGEVAGGLGDIGQGVSALGDRGTPEDQTMIQGLLSTPAAKTGLGAIRVAAAPLAPLDVKAAQGGEAVQDQLLKRGYNPLLAAGAATLADMGINIGGSFGLGAVTKVINRLARGSKALASPRALAKEAGEAGEARLAEVEDRAAQAVTTAQKEAEAARTTAAAKAKEDVAQATQLRDVGIKEAQTDFRGTGPKLAAIKAEEAEALKVARSGAEAANESARSIAEAAKANIPSKENLKAIGGDTLGEATGVKFKEHYDATRATTKEAGDTLYDIALGPRREGKSAVDSVEDLSDIGASFQQRIRNARTPEEQKAAADAFNKFIQTGVAPEETNLRSLHEQLIATRREHRMAAKSQEDNIARLLGEKEKKIVAKMEELSPGVMDKLSVADAAYSTNYAPYFSKGSVTRAIADKDPSVIAQNVILPASKSGKEVATIERAMELMGDNPGLKKDVSHAHLNGLIEKAGRSPDFKKAFVSEWDKYQNRAGNNNKVLRLAYGDEYEDVNSLVNQFRNTTAKSFDDVAESIVAGNNKRLAALEKGITSGAAERAAPLEKLLAGTPGAIEDVVRGTRAEISGIRSAERAAVRAAGKEESGAIAFANKARDIDLAAVKKKMKEEIEQHMGKKVDYQGGKFIGQLFMVEGIFDTFLKGAKPGAIKFLSGGALLLSRTAINKLYAFKRGRSLLKAALRNTPGTAQAAANARLIQTFLNSQVAEDE